MNNEQQVEAVQLGAMQANEREGEVMGNTIERIDIILSNTPKYELGEVFRMYIGVYKDLQEVVDRLIDIALYDSAGKIDYNTKISQGIIDRVQEVADELNSYIRDRMDDLLINGLHSDGDTIG